MHLSVHIGERSLGILTENIALSDLGHSQNQLRTLGVKYGQYPPAGTGRNRPLADAKYATVLFGNNARSCDCGQAHYEFKAL
jgi:hypothetical protein